jgi:glycosyltransferase involved in cell wall biosynthesis
MRILYVIDSLEYSGLAQQMALLVEGAVGHAVDARVCCLRRGGPIAEQLKAANIAVTTIGWNRVVDLSALRRLTNVRAAFAPDIVHVWGMNALYPVILSGYAPRTLLSLPSARRGRGEFTSLMRFAMGRVHMVIVPDRETMIRNRIDERVDSRVHLVRRGVAWRERRAAVGLKQEPCIVAVGPLHRGKGHRDAIWAVDILKYLYNDLSLVIVGDGPERTRLAEFARAIRADDRVRFVGAQARMGPWLEAASVVWAPSVTHGGHATVLDAMSMGCAVVACNVPGIKELIPSPEFGVVVEPGDKVSLARETRRLLDDETRRRRMGHAAQEHVRIHFSADRFVAEYLDRYDAIRARSIPRGRESA